MEVQRFEEIQEAFMERVQQAIYATGAERLHWLAERLAEAPECPTLIFMHHPPFRTGLAPFDQIGLIDADAFAELIAQHAQVERIVAGHVHSAMLRCFAGTLAMTCPATAYTLMPGHVLTRASIRITRAASLFDPYLERADRADQLYQPDWRPWPGGRAAWLGAVSMAG